MYTSIRKENIPLVSLLVLCSTLCFSQDSYEPNDYFSQATILEYSIGYSASICHSKDIDLYKIDNSIPGVLSIELSNVPSAIDLNVEIYDDSQNKILAYSKASTEGQDLSLQLSTCGVSDFLYIKVSDGEIGGHESFDCDNEYLLTTNITTFDSFNEGECNNSFVDAQQVYSIDSISGLISPPFQDSSKLIADKDYYKFTAESSGTLTIELIEVPSDIELEIRIYGSVNQSYVLADNLDQDQEYKVELSTCELGQNFFIVLQSGTAGSSSEQHYIFKVNFLPFADNGTNESECNDSFDDAVEVFSADTITGLISPAYDYNSPWVVDQDFFKFKVPSPGILSVIFTKVPPTFELETKIYSPDKTNRLSYNSDYGFPYRIDLSTTLEEDYLYILIQEFEDFDLHYQHSDEPYIFTVEFLPFEDGNYTENEFNGTFETSDSIVFGDTIVGLIGPGFSYNSEDIDSYKIKLESNAIYEFDFFEAEADSPFLMSILNDQWDVLYSSLFSDPEDRNVHYFYNCDEYEHLYLWITNYPHYSLDEPYKAVVKEYLNLGIEPDGCNNTFLAATSVQLCDSLQAFIGPPTWEGKEYDIYKTALEANTMYELSVLFDQTDLQEITIDIFHVSDLDQPITSYTEISPSNITEVFSTSNAGDYYFIVSTSDESFDIDHSYTFVVGCKLSSNTSSAQEKKSLALFPNPAGDRISSNLSIMQISFISITGVEYQLEIENGNEYDISQLPTGIYFVKAIVDGRIVTDRLIKL